MASPKKTKQTNADILADLIGRLSKAKPDSLRECKSEIRALDRALVALLDRRARLSANQITKIQKDSGGFDPGRRIKALNAIVKESKGDFPEGSLRRIVKELLTTCDDLQGQVIIAVPGAETSFTHLAARHFFGASARTMPHGSIADVFRAVEHEWATFGVVPIENSTGGVIHATLDALVKSEISITSEFSLALHLSLLGSGRLRDIKKVAAPPQTLGQCRIWLETQLPGVQIEHVPTANEGAKAAASDDAVATIGPAIIGELYNLASIEKKIEDHGANITRFVVVGRDTPKPSGHDRTSIMMSLKNRIGELQSALGYLADQKINLFKIESRTTRYGTEDYFFVIEIEGHVEEPIIQKAVDVLRKRSVSFRVLGSYPVFDIEN